MTGGTLCANPRRPACPAFFRYGAFAAVFLLAMAGTATAEPLAIEVVSVQVGYDQRTSEPIISFKMSEATRKSFAELTRNNVGRKLEIRVDGKPLAAPVIREPIVGGTGQISAHFTEQQARDMANRLSSGASKLEMQIVD
jgi:preprotein translocase subunit SecD